MGFTVRILMVTMKTSTKTSTNSTKYKILGNVMTFGAIWLNTNDPPALNRVNVYFCRKAFFCAFAEWKIECVYLDMAGMFMRYS